MPPEVDIEVKDDGSDDEEVVDSGDDDKLNENGFEEGGERDLMMDPVGRASCEFEVADEEVKENKNLVDDDFVVEWYHKVQWIL